MSGAGSQSSGTFRGQASVRLLNGVIREAFSVSSELKVMVVDNLALRVLSSALRVFDLMEEGVTLVEKLELSRQPLRSMEALYMIAPTRSSVEAMLEDYASSKSRKYGDAHVYLIAHLPDDLMALIAASRLAKRIKTLKELPSEFLVPEANVFTLDMPSGLYSAFAPAAVSSRKRRKHAAELGAKLLGVAATLGVKPVVRYAGGSPLARLIGQALVEQVNADKAAPLFASGGQGVAAPVILIVDRSVDVLAPLLHELTYQAMCYDLLPLDGAKYEYKYTDGSGAKQSKTVLLDESDPLWISLRHMHIKDAIDWVQAQFADFLRSNRAAQARGQRMDSLRDMSAAIRALPQYQELLSKYALHIQVCQDNLAVFNERNLEAVIGVEQDMALGEDANGQPVSEVMSALLPLLQDPAISIHDKKRLLLIYIISQEGIRPAERAKLMEKARISPADQNMVSNLTHLQVQVQSMPSRRKAKKKKKKKSRRRAAADEDVGYELSRFTPALKAVMHDLVSGSLDEQAWPTVAGSLPDAVATGASAPSARGKSVRTRQSKWAAKRKNKDKGKADADGATSSTTSQDTFVIFIAGGMSYSEMRAAYEIAAAFRHVNLIIGSTDIVTPLQFMDQLADLDPFEPLYPDDIDGISGPSAV
ncbi:syntaxin-binding protein 1 [Thecamonas trahens ATCC 50062]|uniref:Syntaxin-binding protein 1 n=1 Tax=Thecamonas trahens ATCC 50062 TaxID=461836 RepID=A0A0L0D9K5_THETB|nr:syntaxin-binding protein 1 [Thecamonas trahens ATCC 50062]KNC48746.1 syntaxin-binding protein 1 [Thecamonas trahens ATCC 50062]|eukprot:XP_013762797.1 syntaxin-binding protein 1 [Thecamonas trahens ATCC 50062]